MTTPRRSAGDRLPNKIKLQMEKTGSLTPNEDFEKLGWATAADLINEIQRAFGYDPTIGDYRFDDAKINGDRKSFVANTEAWWAAFHNAKNLISQYFAGTSKMDYFLTFGQKNLAGQLFEMVYLSVYWQFLADLYANT